ncbi:MAG: tetratricopeptide repeat protein [Verrucomicrobia bacterium]|nr:tetratricopeptide repeat protein [Verrucomicrobiota bacterium]MDA1086957.1 tetratricopeptide repeat protein [Verrucomicrobiota bacterium]
MWSRSSRLGGLLGVGLVVTSTVLAQDSPREIRTRADHHLSVGNFMEAIPDLMLLITYYGDSKEIEVINSMELVFYKLPICHFFVGQFKEAEEGLKEFVRRYPRSSHVGEATVFMADSLRYQEKLDPAIKTYQKAIHSYRLRRDMEVDSWASIARSYLAKDQWDLAMEPLLNVYHKAYDFMRQNWAATLLTTAYFKANEIDKVYPLSPILLQPDSFASRSIAFNLAAMEAGDLLFGEEAYREALWVYRMVYPYDLILLRTEEFHEFLLRHAERTRRREADARELMRIQEQIGEIEAELKVLDAIDSYDIELTYRIARGYYELRRFWEGREQFLHLSEIADENLADESIYLAFQCSMQIQPWTRTYKIGEKYMEEYPNGQYFEPITLAMAQLYAREENWPEVIRHLTLTLELRPKHESAAECMFLLGYASFMEEQYKDAVGWFERIFTQFPESELVPPSTYWHAMGLMFDKEYARAQQGFNTILSSFPDSIYAEDAAFRTAVCAYGLSHFEEAEERFAAFIKSYPESNLVAEGTMTRGDVAGAVGRPEDAVQFYQRAMTYGDDVLHIQHYNHCAFQAGTILMEAENFVDARAHFQRYIDRKREESNMPLAIYNIGLCLWNTGEEKGAMKFYRSAVEEFGQDPAAIGIDMILDEWVGRARQSKPDVAARAWDDLQLAYSKARQKKQSTLVLRLGRALTYNPRIGEDLRKQMLDNMLAIKDLSIASPAVLQVLMDAALERKDFERAESIANLMIEQFTETDYALDARMVLARSAIEKASETSNRNQANEHYATALRHLGVISEVYASSGEAGKALLLMGDLHQRRLQYEEADEAYKSVLGHKGWRNLWPQALHGRGDCAYKQRRFEVASAYFERIYVMYSHYKDWTARAYLRRADCLQKLSQSNKARDVLVEMLSIKELDGLPETAEGAALLKQIGGEES